MRKYKYYNLYVKVEEDIKSTGVKCRESSVFEFGEYIIPHQLCSHFN